MASETEKRNQLGNSSSEDKPNLLEVTQKISQVGFVYKSFRGLRSHEQA